MLRQTLDHPIAGYWDGGLKQVFDWEIELHSGGVDSKGRYIRVGSWGANHWFHVALGKTDRLTLTYARKHLVAVTRKWSSVVSTFALEVVPV